MKKLHSLVLLVASSLFGSFLEAQTSARFEAESGVLTGTSLSTSVAGYSGSGYVTDFTDGSDRVAISFEASAGIYKLTIGYRSPWGEKGFGGSVNGGSISGMFPQSSEFTRFDVGAIVLQEGANTISIGGSWSYYEIDYVEIESTEIKSLLPVDPTPVDPEATTEVRALLGYLAENYGKATLSGTQTIRELDVVEGLTDVRPAILGEDFMDYSPSRVANGTNPSGHSEAIIAQSELGHIITMCWHWNAPTDLIDSAERPWWSGFYTNATTFNFALALDDPQSENYALLLRDIDAIAVELKKFSDAKVPVLWRPLHESDGGWFWWGAQGPENLKRLWVLLYERLTHFHGLHNLIWVQTIEDLDWYAGDDYVDILGVDAYPSDPSDPLTGLWTSFLERFDGEKMIALSEFGKVPDVPTMHSLGVRFSYFASWQGELGAAGMSDYDKLRSIYHSEEVITYEELYLESNRYEAENAALVGTMVASGVGGFSGSGYVDGFTDESDRVSFSVEAPAGVYDLKIGYRSPWGAKGFGGDVNGNPISGMFPESSEFTTLEHGSIFLEEGVNTIAIGGGWSYYEIDFIEIEATPIPESADLSGDGEINSEDMSLMRAAMGSRYGDAGYLSAADFDQDGAITRADYSVWYGFARNRK